ncbi:MAG: PAS domain S-box protein [Nitrospirales bacterium]
MTNKDDQDDRCQDPAELRKRAEEMAREHATGSPEHLEALSSEETRRMLHELQVHQIELEMQNEELRMAQTELDAARARYFDLYNLAPVGYCTLSEPGLILEANLTAATLLGVARSALGKQPITRFIFREDQDIYYLHRKHLFETGEPQVCELRMVKKDGAPFWARLEATVAKGADGAPVGRIVLSDITERKGVEQVLRTFKAIFDTANFGAAIGDLNGVLTYVNDCFASVHGYEAQELAGHPLRWSHNETQQEEVELLLGQLTREGSFKAQEVGHCHRDGTEFPMLMTGHVVRDEHGEPECFAATAIDLSEQKALESRLQQAQKMESVGRLAGGVAHDFNNMLGVILGHTDLALMRVDPASPFHVDLMAIRKAAEHSADLTRQLLAFARKQTVAPKVLDLNEAVEGMIEMLRRLIGEDIDLAWLPDKNLWPVKVDPSQIDQVLANLCINARDAITGVGTLTIETGSAAFDEAYCAGHPGCVPGEYVLLAVSDDGSGMDKETQEKLFEPFYTTKAMGKGTGLGLATVYGIVKQNNGFINVYSEPGHGTTFKIYLPWHVGKAEQRKSIDSPQAISHGHETVLLVEDESQILTITTTMLEHHGYTVLAASTPSGAIRLAYDHPGEIHLLITDVVMPEMNGRKLAERLMPLHSTLKLLFMSGYTANVIAHQGVLDEGVHFIQKPFSMKDFATKVREVLDQK